MTTNSTEHVLEYSTRLYNEEYPGPTLRFKAGDVVRVNLINDLDDPAEAYETDKWNEFEKAQITNLHTHGLHVSSKGNSDNVFIEVDPGDSHQYVYEIHPDHAPGLSYYHSHLHGAGYMQVMGGLYGTLIVDLPADSAYDPLRSLPEHVIMLGVINANGLEDRQSLERLNLVSGSSFFAGLVHEYPDYQQYALVNGIFQPTLTIPTNRLQHLRITNTGSLGFLLLHDEDCEWYELAKDAIYFDAPIAVDMVYLGPANRVDLLVSCPTPGLFAVYSNFTSEADYLTSDLVKQTVLYLQVEADSSGSSAVDIADIVLPPRPEYLPDMQSPSPVDIYKAQDITMDYGEKISGDKLQCRGDISEVWKVGRAYEANLTSTAFHPLHMHVNHFQVVDYEYSGSRPDMVLFRVGEYRDTVPLISGLKVRVRFFLDSFTGAVLSHCHVAHHADQGMVRLQYIAEDDDLDFRDNFLATTIHLDDPNPLHRRVISTYISDDCELDRPCDPQDAELPKNRVDPETGEEYYSMNLLNNAYVYWVFERGEARRESGMYVEARGSGGYEFVGGWSAPFNPDPENENYDFESLLPFTITNTTEFTRYEFFFRYDTLQNIS